MEGRLGAPIYGMLHIEDLIEEYTAPDGVKMEVMPKTILGKPGDWTFVGTRADASQSGYEWTGEWTVTYETFRDMGGAFMAALVLIYGLIVWEFKNFALAGLIMSPIPITMMGIIPGHWIMGAEFTATSMIGMIALGGIIVRQSILIVEFVKLEVAKGNEVQEAAVRGAELRMRPIFITSLTLMAGAFAIIDDPIFNGMAISLVFGAGVATVMALIIIPLGCISARKQFYIETSDDGSVFVSPSYARIEHVDDEVESTPSGTPFLMKIWGGIFSALTWVFYIFRAVFTMAMMGVKSVFGMFGGRGGGGTPPPPRAPTPGGGTPPPPRGGGTPPPPRETPVTARGGTPPPPRETPVTAKGGTPPPPRETPATTAGGTPPPPRETPSPAPPPVTSTGTPPPPRETPPATTADTVPPAATVVADAESQVDAEDGIDDETSDTVGRKRRGIRLKQDLT
jgi:hypothetical protein